jgi:hypothetical protein
VIRGYCRTNLDEYKGERWPDMFVAVPKLGDSIVSKSGKILTVVKITHLVNWRGSTSGTDPYIEVELHRGR